MPIAAGPASFRTEVVEASHDRLVVVDFWAPWCKPCLALAPILERKEAADGGRWKLVKVDVQEHQDLGRMFGIQSIPCLKAFHAGAIVGELIGNVAEGRLSAWLDDMIPGEEQGAIAAGRAAEAAGDWVAARGHYEEAKAAKPSATDAAAGLARALVHTGDLAGAARALDALQGADRALVSLLIAAAGEAADDYGTRYVAAIRDALGGEYEAALVALLDLVRRDRSWGEDAARKRMLDVFSLAGERSPLSERYRRQLAMALY